MYIELRNCTPGGLDELMVSALTVSFGRHQLAFTVCLYSSVTNYLARMSGRHLFLCLFQRLLRDKWPGKEALGADSWHDDS